MTSDVGMATKRLTKELQEFGSNPLDNVTASRAHMRRARGSARAGPVTFTPQYALARAPAHRPEAAIPRRFRVSRGVETSARRIHSSPRVICRALFLSLDLFSHEAGGHR